MATATTTEGLDGITIARTVVIVATIGMMVTEEATADARIMIQGATAEMATAIGTGTTGTAITDVMVMVQGIEAIVIIVETGLIVIHAEAIIEIAHSKEGSGAKKI